MRGRRVGRICVSEREVLAADVELDHETGMPESWSHDGGAFDVISAEPVRSVERSEERLWFLIVEPAPGNRGPHPERDRW